MTPTVTKTTYGRDEIMTARCFQLRERERERERGEKWEKKIEMET